MAVCATAMDGAPARDIMTIAASRNIRREATHILFCKAGTSMVFSSLEHCLRFMCCDQKRVSSAADPTSSLALELFPGQSDHNRAQILHHIRDLGITESLFPRRHARGPAHRRAS